MSQKVVSFSYRTPLWLVRILVLKESEILPIISSAMKSGGINSSEDLIQMVLKGL